MSVRMLAGAVVASAVLGWGAGAAAPGAEPAGRRDTHENLHAVLWMQTSAEYQAITRGLYHLAAAQLDRALEDPRWTAVPEQAGGPICRHWRRRSSSTSTRRSSTTRPRKGSACSIARATCLTCSASG